MEEILGRVSNLSGDIYGLMRLLCKDEALTPERLDNLVSKVVCDRWKLALEFFQSTGNLSLDKGYNLRTVISQDYYACYHAARALVFLITKADVDDHKKLPLKLRECLTKEDSDKADFLDEWRKIRNEVEYSPWVLLYPLCQQKGYHKDVRFQP